MLKQYCKSSYLTSSAEFPFWRKQFANLEKAQILQWSHKLWQQEFYLLLQSPIPVRSKVQGQVRSSPLSPKIGRSKIQITKPQGCHSSKKGTASTVFLWAGIRAVQLLNITKKPSNLFSALSSTPLEISKSTLHTYISLHWDFHTQTRTKEEARSNKSYCAIFLFVCFSAIDDKGWHRSNRK